MLVGTGVLFARDLQLPTGNVFQETATLIMYVSNDGRAPHVAVTAPGLVGSITAFGLNGVSMGVDVVRGGTFTCALSIHATTKHSTQLSGHDTAQQIQNTSTQLIHLHNTPPLDTLTHHNSTHNTTHSTRAQQQPTSTRPGSV